VEGSLPIESFLEKYASRLEAWVSSLQLDLPPESQSRSRLERGLPWIEAEGLKPDPAQATEVLRDLLSDLRASAMSNLPVLDRVLDAVRTEKISGAAFLKALLDRDGATVDSMAERVGVPTQILHFIGVFFARPFLAAAHKGFDPSSVGAEEAGALCPVCGQEPALAVLMVDDGRRRLWCRCCGAAWTVRRLRCLSCGNEDSASLGYFSLEGEIGRRVDYCEKCRRYIKTIDLRAGGGVQDRLPGDMDDLTSGDLDDAAVREGFIPLMGEEVSAEWRRTGMGSERERGGLS